MIQNFYRYNRDLKQMSKSICMALEEIMKHYKLFTNYLTESGSCMFQLFHTEVWSTQPFLFILQYQLCDMLLVVSLKCWYVSSDWSYTMTGYKMIHLTVAPCYLQTNKTSCFSHLSSTIYLALLFPHPSLVAVSCHHFLVFIKVISHLSSLLILRLIHLTFSKKINT